MNFLTYGFAVIVSPSSHQVRKNQGNNPISYSITTVQSFVL